MAKTHILISERFFSRETPRTVFEALEAVLKTGATVTIYREMPERTSGLEEKKDDRHPALLDFALTQYFHQLEFVSVPKLSNGPVNLNSFMLNDRMPDTLYFISEQEVEALKGDQYPLVTDYFYAKKDNFNFIKTLLHYLATPVSEPILASSLENEVAEIKQEPKPSTSMLSSLKARFFPPAQPDISMNSKPFTSKTPPDSAREKFTLLMSDFGDYRYNDQWALFGLGLAARYGALSGSVQEDGEEEKVEAKGDDPALILFGKILSIYDNAAFTDSHPTWVEGKYLRWYEHPQLNHIIVGIAASLSFSNKMSLLKILLSTEKESFQYDDDYSEAIEVILASISWPDCDSTQYDGFLDILNTYAAWPQADHDILTIIFKFYDLHHIPIAQADFIEARLNEIGAAMFDPTRMYLLADLPNLLKAGLFVYAEDYGLNRGEIRDEIQDEIKQLVESKTGSEEKQNDSWDWDSIAPRVEKLEKIKSIFVLLDDEDIDVEHKQIFSSVLNALYERALGFLKVRGYAEGIYISRIQCLVPLLAPNQLPSLGVSLIAFGQGCLSSSGLGRFCAMFDPLSALVDSMTEEGLRLLIRHIPLFLEGLKKEAGRDNWNKILRFLGELFNKAPHLFSEDDKKKLLEILLDKLKRPIALELTHTMAGTILAIATQIEDMEYRDNLVRVFDKLSFYFKNCENTKNEIKNENEPEALIKTLDKRAFNFKYLEISGYYVRSAKNLFVACSLALSHQNEKQKYQQREKLVIKDALPEGMTAELVEVIQSYRR